MNVKLVEARPHYTAPSVQTTHLIICYKNFMANNPAFSHVGLGINALLTGKMLRANNIRCDVIPIETYDHVVKAIDSNPTVTHLLIEAPFLGNGALTTIVNKYHEIEFSCRCHSQIGFLQVEAQAINLIRDYIRLQDQSLNFKVAVNSPRMGTFLQQVYGSSVLLLPNLYYIDNVQVRHWQPPGSTIRVGSFGAIRILKNAITAAAAALTLASVHKKQLEFYLSVNRVEQGIGVLQAIRNMFISVPFAKLVEVPWATWSDFKRIIGNLDLHMQLSMSETFNITTADACAVGIPTCASEAIDWVPKRWICDIDNADDVARKGWDLLNDPSAAHDGMQHLKSFNQDSLGKWISWFSGSGHSTMPGYHDR